jgi:transcriptional regulator with XRE-family HTH domain
MTAVDRALARATHRAERALISVGDEVREARIAAGWSQERVGLLVGISRSKVTRIEGGKLRTVSILDVSRVAGALGLELAVRIYPGSGPLRDSAHSARLGDVLEHAAPPLRVRREVPLPSPDGRPEMRAWDAVIVGHGLRTTIELEMRLRDSQALERRIGLKRRDDPADRFVLLVAATHGNRRALAAGPTIFADLPRRGPRVVIDALKAGRHPPSCLVVV